ncbi:TIM barrel protein [Candidatus Dojkabacteria bacterium]|uniref:TIM barrel protein n=1 Tax=Candidatus Dojkabacteria bacterium TaxID=2099670 RepID=A0A955RKL8_9BACT|nr:TIM barrel protein [Candidatus Dojkabacteria bacterium]
MNKSERKLRFGTGGMPLTTKNRSVTEGIKRIRELGLDAMELEFVYQIFVKEEEREALKKLAEEQDVALSVHGSYFINLASPEKQKWHASINRVLQSAEAGEACGARSMTFHPAAYMKRDAEEVYSMVKEAFKEIWDGYEEKGLTSITIAPELTGKAAQFGDLEVLIRLIEDFPGKPMKFCFDFAHKHARDGGGWNSYEEFDQMLGLIRKHFGQTFLDDMHIHISGIQYSPKGERNHLTLLPSQEAYREEGIDVGGLAKYYAELEQKGRLETPDIKWKELLTALKDNKVGGIVVCESPNLEEDALLMQQYYHKL